jgi:hypothetical protein
MPAYCVVPDHEMRSLRTQFTYNPGTDFQKGATTISFCSQTNPGAIRKLLSVELSTDAQ